MSAIRAWSANVAFWDETVVTPLASGTDARRAETRLGGSIAARDEGPARVSGRRPNPLSLQALRSHSRSNPASGSASRPNAISPQSSAPMMQSVCRHVSDGTCPALRAFRIK